MRRLSRILICILAGLALALTLRAPLGQTAPGGNSGGYAVTENADQSLPAATWPKQIQADDSTITVYQPQLDAWQGELLTGRAAVSVLTSASPTPTYGVLWFSARTEVDKEARVVSLWDIRITRASLPQAPAGGPDYLQILRQNIPTAVQMLPLEQLEASLAVTQARQQQRRQPLENAAPHIYFSAAPAMLVLIDGPPALREAPGTSLLRVINTRALLLNQTSGTYYLYLMDRWMQASALQGPWTAAKNPPASLDSVKQAADAAQNVDLMDNPTPEVQAALERDQPVSIYVSTTPAELVEANGQPKFEPIAGTNLLWASNTHASLFMNVSDQNYYLLLSGRWYRTRSLTNGPWSFVSGADLPADFAKIPETHPAGDALPSVPGTLQAQQALIANHIPQTATVRRDTAHLTVTYDGAPDFEPIEGNSLHYAVNTSTPVILVSPGVYYACENGVWFTGSSPTGPWMVATSVPDVIYTIPVTCPINYVTNAYVYGFTPEVVYVGYTPGYLGAYVEPYGCVVYGSGYAYPGWVGSVWYGAPVTFGLGAAFDWTIGTGWSFGFGWGWGPIWQPWWGPWWGRWHYHEHRPKDHGPWRWHDANLNHYIVYDRWDHQVVSSLRPLPIRPGHIRIGPAPQAGGNNLIAGHDGSVYRRGPDGWEVRQGDQWRPVQSPVFAHKTLPNPSNPVRQPTVPGGRIESPAYLNQVQQARTLGQERTNAARSNPGMQNPVVPRINVPARPVMPSLPSYGGIFGGAARRGGFGGVLGGSQGRGRRP